MIGSSYADRTSEAHKMITNAPCTLLVAAVATTVAVSATFARAAEPAAAPSFTKQIDPIFKKYCAECHNADDLTGGLSVENLEELIKGGDNGKAIVAGSAAQSRLVQMVEGTRKPKMPPGKKPQPKAEEIALVKAWIDAGAKSDGTAGKPAAEPKTPAGEKKAVSASKPAAPKKSSQSEVAESSERAKLPEIQPRVHVAPQISAVAYRPDGKLLAAAAHGDVLLIDPPHRK